MSNGDKDCSCSHDLSRRGMLKAGLAAAATAAIGLGGEGAAETEAAARAQTKQVLTTAGVRPVDIHAHYYPQSFFDVFLEDGKRFGAEFHKTDEGFTFKTPAGNQPVPVPRRKRLSQTFLEKFTYRDSPVTRPRWAIPHTACMVA